jgi:hypothetical protein
MTLSGYTYACSAGETFDQIALDIYGDEIYAAELMGANPELCSRLTFQGREEIYLPVIETPEERDSALPLTAPWREEA